MQNRFAAVLFPGLFDGSHCQRNGVQNRANCGEKKVHLSTTITDHDVQQLEPNMETSNIEDLKQSYLEGKMEPSELLEFEQKIKSDPELAREIKELQRIDLGLQALNYESFKNEVLSWEGEYKTKPDVIPLNRYIAIAAGILLLLIPTVMLLYNSQGVDSSNLYAQYYAPYQDVVLERGDDSEVQEILAQSMQEYNSENYRTAIPGFTDYLDQNPEDYKVYLYLGICQLEIDQFADAEEIFIRAENDPYFKQQAQWYRAMTYLKGDQKQPLVDILDLIASQTPRHYQQGKAIELLDIFKAL